MRNDQKFREKCSRAGILEPNEFESERSPGTLLNWLVNVLKQSGDLRGRGKIKCIV